MQPFPHHYTVAAVADADGDITLEGAGLPRLHSALPPEFGGMGDRWSPETLLVAAVADCFVLTFRGIADASRLPWISLTCEVAGTLDRVEGVARFTRFELHARLQLFEGTNEAQAHRVLTKAEEGCLVTRSLSASTHLDVSIQTVAPHLV
jgi:organic hydroperoxide reductase OsmC/OhrA